MAGQKPDKPQYQGERLPLRVKQAVPLAVTWMACVYLLILPIAEMALRGGVEMNHDRAWFSVVNAVTLTGFELTIATNTYPLPAQIVVLTLTIVGMLFTMMVGGMAVVRILRLPYSDGQVARAAGWACGVLIAVGAMPLIWTGQEPLRAFMLAASALGNSGLYFGSLPGMMSWQTHLIVMPLSILGGLGLPVLMELWDAAMRRRALSYHSRVVIGVTAGLYLAVLAACFLLKWMDAGSGLRWQDYCRLAGSSSVAAVNSRTAGFPFELAQDMPRGMQWILILAMIIGGSPAGTAGGLKTTTVAALARGIGDSLRGKSAGRAFAVAATWLWIYAGIVVVVLISLLAAVPQVAADRLLFEAISALSNVGLSHEVLMIVGAGLNILSAAMLVGRLAPLAILWWMARGASDGEADLAVG